MKLLTFIKNGDMLAPIYCNPLVKAALPFSHGHIDLVAGDHFGAVSVGDRTIVTLKPDAGASFHPPFKLPGHHAQIREAIQGLRAAACHKVYTAQAKGETLCQS